jgi:phospholipase/carboxylesterase
VRPPAFWGRGGHDTVIPRAAVERTDSWMRAHTDVTEHVYPQLGHDVAGREIDDFTAFVRRRIV